MIIYVVILIVIYKSTCVTDIEETLIFRHCIMVFDIRQLSDVLFQ